MIDSILEYVNIFIQMVLSIIAIDESMKEDQMGKKIVIIGGVAGGASAAARLRRLDETAQIIMFERGPYISYANCGLPYHIGDVIKNRENLLLQTPKAMAAKYNVEVSVDTEVISIDRENQLVSVKHTKTGAIDQESYDTLVISTGSTPLKPAIEGIDLPGIFTLWTVPDMDEIKNFIRENSPQHAVVIGGGFIGLEVAENLHGAGIKVTVAEAMDQVLAPIDVEMAGLIQNHMSEKGVSIILGDGVSKFERNGEGVTITLASGRTLSADMVLLSIGVRPNSQLAKEAGLELNQRGGIVVDPYLRTSDPNIYALGDVIEVEEYINKGRAMIALAGPANKQGRILANNIYCANEAYRGTMGTSIAKIFDLTAASTGANEKTLMKMGLKEGKDYHVTIISQKSHAGYYPGAAELMLKLLFSVDGKKIYGAQIVGEDGADKRIDTIATAIGLGASVYDLKELELAYAPPYSSAKDPVNMLGFVAENVIQGKVKFSRWDEFTPEKQSTAVVLDVREAVELMTFELPNAKHIPLGELRSRIHELDQNRKIIVFCAVGVRSYNAARILAEHGFDQVYVYPAGTSFYRAIYGDGSAESHGSGSDVERLESILPQEEIKSIIQVDCSGLQCPGPIVKVYEAMDQLKDGEVVCVSATDAGFARDIEAWCRRTGNTLLKVEKEGRNNIVYLQKGMAHQEKFSLNSVAPSGQGLNQGKTIIVFSGDLDKVLASFIIANGAAAMGRPVTMFFTFWGLNVLRKPKKQSIKKPLIDGMFGKMMPRGTGKLKLSKMNMGGMGTAMMRKVMKDKNIDSLEDLIKTAMGNGVKMIACTMSMDVMGITAEELMEGVEFAGVGTYLGDAEESNVNLFI